MIRMHDRARVRLGAPRGGPLALLLIAGIAAFGGSAARAEPPIRSAEDAACRLEARARVFSTPNPRGLELEVHGRQIYHACMRRIAQAEAPPRKRTRRGRRHR